MSRPPWMTPPPDFGPLFKTEPSDARSNAAPVPAAAPPMQPMQPPPGGARSLPAVPMPGVPVDRPASRASNPETSREAARRVAGAAGLHRAAILEALQAGEAGQTEIAARAGMTVAAVSKRLCELRRAGQIVQCGTGLSATGGRETLYRLNGGDGNGLQG